MCIHDDNFVINGSYCMDHIMDRRMFDFLDWDMLLSFLLPISTCRQTTIPNISITNINHT